MAAPMIIMKETQQREEGRSVQRANIAAAKAVSDIVRTCLGPRAMLKMLLDPMGGIVMTNDGNCILREIQVQHPAAKSVIEISRTQDEEVGDGTTSVVILAGELMSLSESLLDQSYHPIHIINGFRLALDDALEVAKSVAIPLDTKNVESVRDVVKCCLGTKINHVWADLVCKLAGEAVNIVDCSSSGRQEIDFKRYARIEKIPGGHITDSHVLKGIMLNKDVVHTGMRRRIVNPRIILLDCGLEYKKGESQTNIELMKSNDLESILRIEEESVKKMCMEVLAHKPDLVFTEKGCSDLAQHYFQKAGVSVIRRVKKSDNNRLARAVGATVVNRPEDISPEDVGTGAGLFEIKKIGDEYYTYIVDCSSPKACTIVLRGGSKDILNEIERNLTDALNVTRNLKFDPTIVPGGGAFEIAIGLELDKRSKGMSSILQTPYQVASQALDVIPRTLIHNCGGNQLNILTELKSRQITEISSNFGVNGLTGVIEDMVKAKIVDNTSVKTQILKVAFETVMMLLKIDNIVSGAKKMNDDSTKPGPQVTSTEATQPE